jgi:hypothetical protein
MGPSIEPRPSEIGARAEAAVASALVRAGRAVFMPVFSTHSRVDLIYIDSEAERVARLQCKSARRIRDVLFFRTCSNTANSPREYVGQIDEFGVFSPNTGLVYLVPNDGLPYRGCSLRLSETRNGQTTGIRWASAYELGPP